MLPKQPHTEVKSSGSATYLLFSNIKLNLM